MLRLEVAPRAGFTRFEIGGVAYAEVEPHSTEPHALDALDATIKQIVHLAVPGTPASCSELVVVDGRYFVPAGFIATCCERQGYVRKVFQPGKGASDG